MTPSEARAALVQAGLTQSDLARLLIELGDTRPLATIQRAIRHQIGQDRAEVPWALAALLRLLARKSA
jgi:hypothetical protein